MKPDPAAWAALLEDGMDATDVLVVDDQTCKLDTTRSLGITAVPATGDVPSFVEARTTVTR